MFNEENHPLLIGYSDEDRKGTELKSINTPNVFKKGVPS